jgi:hypothetical protein
MDGIDEDMVNEALNRMFTAKDLTSEGAAKLASSRIGGANHLNSINSLNSSQSTTPPAEVRNSELHVMRRIGSIPHRLIYILAQLCLTV